MPANSSVMGAKVVSGVVGYGSGVGALSMLLPDNWLVHLVAGGLGALLALAILTPSGLIEALVRLFAGITSAFVLTNPAIEFFDWLPGSNVNLMVGSIVGFTAWFLLGGLAKTLDVFRSDGAWSFVKGKRDKK